MRLLDTRKLTMVDFVGEVPPYAILSHTWGSSEVTYQDFNAGRSNQHGHKDYAKLENACRQALQDGYEYIWIDTCCIDKSSSAELTEAINSMFNFYQDAARCYVYLSDVNKATKIEDGLRTCRWMTRGWTLQELIAPKDVLFFDDSWQFRGTKRDLAATIAEVTRVPVDVLTAEKEATWYSVASRMSWAARRNTTRKEDSAYCLLGLFDVNMPLLYGEGHKAFRRLQEEIIKRNGDLTIMAWESHHPESFKEGTLAPLLAPSAECFVEASNTTAQYDHGLDFSVTNKGLMISGPVRIYIVRCPDTSGHLVDIYAFDLGDPGRWNSRALALRKINPKLYVRDDRFSLKTVADGLYRYRSMADVSTFYIVIDPMPAHKSMIDSYRTQPLGALRVLDTASIKVQTASPSHLWDATDHLFLRAHARYQDRHGTAYILKIQVVLPDRYHQFILFSRSRIGMGSNPTSSSFNGLYICPVSKYPNLTEFIFPIIDSERTISWSELVAREPAISELPDTYVFEASEDTKYKISCKPSSAFITAATEVVRVQDVEITVEPLSTQTDENFVQSLSRRLKKT